MGIDYFNNNANMDYFSLIAQGKDPNNSSVYKFGRNGAVGSTEVLIWDGAGLFTLPTSAGTVTVTSDSGSDAFPAGIGARTVRVFGLDTDYNEVNEVVNIGGTSTATFLRVYRAWVETAGTITPLIGGNVGTITITHNGTTLTIAQILPKKGQTLMSIFTIPAGFTGLLWATDADSGEGKDAIVTLYTRDNLIADTPFRAKIVLDVFQNSVDEKLKIPLSIPEKTDIVMSAVSSAAGTAISSSFELQIVRDE